MDRPLVSLVFVAFNRREELAVSLTKVTQELDYPRDRLEVLVVDNASTDGTALMVRERFPGVQLIRNPENVGASAWNVGMASARGEWRMILDDDCYIEGDMLDIAVRRAEEHRADLVSFRIASGVDGGYFNPGNSGPGLLGFVGCAVLLGQQATEALNPIYDPNIFIWANEIETTIRLLDHGFRHLYLPEVSPVHQKPLPSDEFRLEFAIINHKHWAYVAGKLLQPGDAAAVLGRLVLRTLVDAVRIDPQLVRGLPSLFAGFARGLRSRRPVRPAVSAVYLRANVNFSNPLQFMRTPWQRLRRSDADAQRAERRQRWEHEAGRYYPSDMAVLEI